MRLRSEQKEEHTKMKLSRFAIILVLSTSGYAQQATPAAATQTMTSQTATSQTVATVIFYREATLQAAR
jgi:hypothetical protein